MPAVEHEVLPASWFTAVGEPVPHVAVVEVPAVYVVLAHVQTPGGFALLVCVFV